MLNHEDVSEYLKIGPNGLEVKLLCLFLDKTSKIWKIAA